MKYTYTQVGSFGILMLLDMFSDINTPGLKGKLKIFILGLCLGHPVHSPQSAEGGEESAAARISNEPHDKTLGDANVVGSKASVGTGKRRSTLNILKSVACGGKARVHSCPTFGRYRTLVYR